MSGNETGSQPSPAHGAPPAHHVPDETLLEDAGGALAPAFALAVSCHLTFCARCRAERRRLQDLGGALLETVAPAAMSPTALAQTMARLDDGGVTARSGPSPSGGKNDLLPFDPPPALARRLAEVTPRWRYVAPGTRGIDLPLGSDAETAHLLRLRPGLSIPRHDHGAVEATVVFTGALLDDGQRFGPGDILFRAPGERHEQAVDRGQVCIALVVNAGKLVPLTLKGRLVRLIARP